MRNLKMATGIVLVALSGAAAGDDITDKLNEHARQELIDVFNAAIVVDAIKSQNQRHVNLGGADIEKLDRQWRAEAKNGRGPLIDTVLATALSKHLKGFKNAGQGLYTEVFVMDNKGLNVGQSDVTSDYWQGDEAKFQMSFLRGAGALFVDEVELDESTQTYQSQISMTVVDPATNEPVGAVTVGINVDALQ